MWAAFAPGLHIEDPNVLPQAGFVGFSDQESPRIQAQFREEGYFHASGVNWQLDLPLMVETVRRLSAVSLPPVFGFLFDEFWVPFRKLTPVYQMLLGNYALLPAFWIWDVEPKRAEAGWAPHRDKGRRSLLPDGSAGAISTWIPLTPATPLNGCMYLVPAQHDQTYNTPDEDRHRFDVQCVRALPGVPGDFFMWNQAILHWGGKTSAYATESRISMSVEYQRGDIPSLQGKLLNPHVVLPFRTRLWLIGLQIMQYKHMYKLLPEVEKLADDLMTRPL
ncbi:MAG: phytanoyl-CoA dioxygenase family protein [Rhodospirillaceae bacterium]|nr:phytanoyl-CoA dioxygenase family protein [Rhodospirillaceae bacterium]